MLCCVRRQARNQLGIPGGAKSFLRGAQIFWTVSNSFKLNYVQHIFLGGASPPLHPPGYGPVRRLYRLQNGTWEWLKLISEQKNKVYFVKTKSVKAKQLKSLVKIRRYRSSMSLTRRCWCNRSCAKNIGLTITCHETGSHSKHLFTVKYLLRSRCAVIELSLCTADWLIAICSLYCFLGMMQQLLFAATRKLALLLFMRALFLPVWKKQKKPYCTWRKTSTQHIFYYSVAVVARPYLRFYISSSKVQCHTTTRFLFLGELHVLETTWG